MLDIGSIFLVLAVAVITFLFISRPFYEAGGAGRLLVASDVQHREQERSTLLAERDRVLNSLLELDSDHDLGKLQPEEYARQRESLLKSGADTLKRLDEINLNEAGAAKPPAHSAEDDELEALIAARKKGKQESPSFCPGCGSRLIPGDRFCSTCGAKTNG